MLLKYKTFFSKMLRCDVMLTIQIMFKKKKNIFKNIVQDVAVSR